MVELVSYVLRRKSRLVLAFLEIFDRILYSFFKDKFVNTIALIQSYALDAL